jgi:hypothetical protein
MFDTNKQDVISLKRFKPSGFENNISVEAHSEYKFDADCWFGKSCPPVLSFFDEPKAEEILTDDFLNPYHLLTDYDGKLVTH